MGMTRRPMWVVFDVGGVLLDWRSSLSAVAAELGITRDQLLGVLFGQSVPKNIGTAMLLGEIPAEAGWAVVLKRLAKNGYDPAPVFAQTYAAKFWSRDTLKLAGVLHETGYKLAIMSNSWLGLTDPKKKEDFPKELQLFDNIFDSSVEGMKKPDVTFYELAEQRTEAKRKDLFLIDDDEENLATAKQRGWQTFRYEMGDERDGHESNKELRSMLL